MNKLNKRGPRISPWGTPMTTDLVPDDNPLKFTCLPLLDKKESIKSKNAPLNPYYPSLYESISY